MQRPRPRQRTAVAAGARATASSAHRPIDRLFHMMFESKASDLHLSVGMTPLVRKDGEIKLLDESAPASIPNRCGRCSIRSCRKRTARSSHARHDTDFAYEIAGLARFRSNIFMDRKGPGAVFRVIPVEDHDGRGPGPLAAHPSSAS